ncbi:MAG: DNA-directed RNA polymerase subunit omega [Planctomycetes bacterium]|nr:DNA-directed RNA polymerase subunit omega [Planctomycetota bacterium]
MLDELREEKIVEKVGGRFKLSTLIQKRLVQINAGSRPLVDMDTDNMMAIVVQEIVQDKIYLDNARKVQTQPESAADGGPPILDLENL